MSIRVGYFMVSRYFKVFRGKSIVSWIRRIGWRYFFKVLKDEGFELAFSGYLYIRLGCGWN